MRDIPALTPARLPKVIWYFLGEDRRRYVGHMSVFLLGQLYELVPPLLIGLLVDFLVKRQTGESLWPAAWIIIGLAVSNAINAVLRLNSRQRLFQIALNSRYRAKVWGFEKLLAFSLDWHQKENTGNKAQRVLTGAESVRMWAEIHNDLLPLLVSFTGTVIACALLHPLSILFFVFFVLGLVGIELFYDRKIARLNTRINASSESASGVFVESASNILAVKALGASAGIHARVQDSESLSRDLSHERVRLGARKWMCFQIHNSISWAAYLAGITAAVLGDLLSVGLVLTYTQYFNSLRTSSMNFTDKFQTLIERYTDLTRIMPIFRGADHAAKKPDAPFPSDWESIRYTDVDFRHGDRQVFSSLDLCVKRGEKIGLAGPSGSGKSTLLRLLLSLHAPERGRVTIGETAVTEIDNDALTTHVAVVLQETELFNLSLKDNIGLLKEVDAERFRIACWAAGLDELIQRLPERENTMLGEKGHALSGGERQRVGIARALYKNAQILLLDEATSALDATTEAMVMKRVLSVLPEDTTVIISAHRLSTLSSVDRVLHLGEGRVIDECSYEALTQHSAA